MRKIITLTVFFCLFLLTAKAYDRKFTFGMQFTNGISFMNSDNVNITPTNVGYAFDYGMFMNYNFSENYAVSTGVIIDHIRAGRANSPEFSNASMNQPNNTWNFLSENNYTLGAKESLKYTYISLPISFRLSTNEFGYLKYFGEFGVVNSFRVRSRLSIDGSDIQNENINKKENLGDFRSSFYNASLLVGGGIEYAFSDKTSLMLKLSFQNGFVNIVNDGYDERTVLRIVKLTTGIIF